MLLEFVSFKFSISMTEKLAKGLMKKSNLTLFWTITLIKLVKMTDCSKVLKKMFGYFKCILAIPVTSKHFLVDSQILLSNLKFILQLKPIQKNYLKSIESHPKVIWPFPNFVQFKTLLFQLMWESPKKFGLGGKT